MPHFTKRLFLKFCYTNYGLWFIRLRNGERYFLTKIVFANNHKFDLLFDCCIQNHVEKIRAHIVGKSS